jgi:hypothetical protein
MTNNKTWVKFLKLKDKTLKAFKNFKAAIENETIRRIKALKFDSGKKYTSKKFNEFHNSVKMKKKDELSVLTLTKWSCQKKNKSLLEIAKCIVIEQTYQ